MKLFVPLFLLCLSSTLATERVGPWNLDTLFDAPVMRWEDRSAPVHSLLYAGEPVKGVATEVFAFYASPSTLDPNTAGPFPGVVLIHGGGGTAFAEWAWLWAKRGYAAIAMDLSGRRPLKPQFHPDGTPVPNQSAKQDTRTKLPMGGLDHTHSEKFDCILTEDTSDDWPYHAVASTIRAHSLLRSLDEVDAERTAVTGISWGGYTTCLVASVDHRFKAAVPVYGCGFLHEGESVQKPSIDQLGDHRAAWIREYDPGSLLPRCQVPILFVNGTNDVHYALDSYQKSFDQVPGEKHLRIEVNMRHGHPPGWEPKEIGRFIDSKCKNGPPLASLVPLVITPQRVRLPFTSTLPIGTAELHYTVDGGPRSKRQWHSLPGAVAANEAAFPPPPAAANTWFIAITDADEAMVTSPIQFSQP